MKVLVWVIARDLVKILVIILVEETILVGKTLQQDVGMAQGVQIHVLVVVVAHVFAPVKRGVMVTDIINMPRYLLAL